MINCKTRDIFTKTSAITHINTVLIAICAALCLFSLPAYCLPAGTLVHNTASVGFVIDGTPHRQPSNTVVTAINTLADVQNTAISAVQDTIAPNVSGYSYAFIVTNTGNAPDRFSLDAAFTDLSAPVEYVWIDTNGNGKLDPATDQSLSSNDLTVQLDAGASVHLLVEAQAGGTMRLTATSLNDDAAAVIWHRSAAAEIKPSSLHGNFVIRLIKSQTVDTRGADQPGTGTIITYSLQAALPALANATQARIHDTVPAGTTYVAGSLMLDDTPLSDAADNDAGTFDAATGAILVALPDPPSDPPDDGGDTATHVVRFQVRIN